MGAVARARDSDVGAGLRAALLQPRHEIAWNERRVAGNGHDMGNIREMRRDIIQAREHAGEWSSEARDVVANHGETDGREPRGIAVGVQRESGALGAKPPRETRDDRLAPNRDHPLVDAAEPTRPPAGKNNSKGFAHYAAFVRSDCYLSQWRESE